MKILYYITAHGYGHAMRACAIGSEFSAETRLFVRTSVPRKFLAEEMKRPFDYFPGQFDCGCVQKDSVTVDRQKTLETYMKIAEGNEAGLEEEAQWCLDQGIRGIVSDITPFAFEVARKAGLPSVAVSNFTWYDIYEPYVGDHPGFQPYLEKIRDQYRMADLLLELWPANDMAYFHHRFQVPLVGRKGRRIRGRLTKELGLLRENRLAMVYVGEFGMDGICWRDLEKFPEWDFIGIYPLPGNPANYHLLKKEDFPYPDLTASADVMISKLGYGTFAECLLNGTPLMYLPREDFAEYPTLEKALIDWGQGFCLSREDYFALNWEQTLARVLGRKRPRPRTSNAPGICARKIEEVFSRATSTGRASREG